MIPASLESDERDEEKLVGHQVKKQKNLFVVVTAIYMAIF